MREGWFKRLVNNGAFAEARFHRPGLFSFYLRVAADKKRTLWRSYIGSCGPTPKTQLNLILRNLSVLRLKSSDIEGRVPSLSYYQFSNTKLSFILNSG